MPTPEQDIAAKAAAPVVLGPVALVTLVLITAILSWQGSQVYSDIARTRTENIELKAKNTELARELEKCSNRTGFRPGSPIGSSPAGSAPTGATPEPTPNGA